MGKSLELAVSSFFCFLFFFTYYNLAPVPHLCPKPSVASAKAGFFARILNKIYKYLRKFEELDWIKREVIVCQH
jgi:hypothetical protein